MNNLSEKKQNKAITTEVHFSYAVGERNVHQIWVTCSWKAWISDHSNVTVDVNLALNQATKQKFSYLVSKLYK